MSDPVKSAIVVIQKDDYVLGEDNWEELVPVGVVRAVSRNGEPAFYFVGHSHYEGKLRSVFQTNDQSEINEPSMTFLRDRLDALGHVKHPSEKEFNVAKENFQSESSN